MDVMSRVSGSGILCRDYIRAETGFCSMLFGKTSILLITALIGSSSEIAANNANLYVEEILAGANGDSRVQFIVVRQGEAGENLWGPQSGESHSRAMLVFYDGLGRETGTFRFPEDPPTGGTLRTLLATASFAALEGTPTPDLLIPPLLNAYAGRVCFRNNPRNVAAEPKVDCLAYGGDSGAPDLPITGTVSLYRDSPDAPPRARAAPSPGNVAGETGRLTPAPLAIQGAALFSHETFSGNGRTCATCHVAGDGYGLTPAGVRERASTLGEPTLSFDPLFIAETSYYQMDTGLDFNLNTMDISREVDTPVPCTGELRGLLSGPAGGRARVLGRTGPTTYLVYGGLTLRGTVTDGICRAEVLGVTPGDLDAIEDPEWLRGAPDPAFPEGRALVLENVDGFGNPPVFRRSPHLINLAYTAPYGFSGDVPDLRTFTTTAVIQHLPRTLARSPGGPNPDFRLPTPGELDAIEAFLLSIEFPSGSDPEKFDLTRYATTADQRRGMEEFEVFGCAACHGGPTLSQTTIPIQGKAVGINAAFNTGTTQGRFRGGLPCEPATETVGPCGSREISTPQLFDLPHLGPYFHNGSAATLEEAVNFYNTSEFGNSPSNQALIAQGVGVVPTPEILAFLEGLVERPYALTVTGNEPGSYTIRVENTGIRTLRFEDPPCRLDGRDARDFRIAACPLTGLAAGQTAEVTVTFDPPSDSAKQAILEVHPLDEAPSGIDLGPMP
jgi:cytochrome c peroxidase